MLAIVGTLALTGMVLKLAWFHGARKVSYSLYLVMGWVAIIAAPALVDSLTGVQLGLIVAGGAGVHDRVPGSGASPTRPVADRVRLPRGVAPAHGARRGTALHCRGRRRRLGAARPSMFDRFVVVDWSANSTPKLGRDSIWVAQTSMRPGTTSVTNLPTRRQAEAFLGDLLETEPNADHAGRRRLLARAIRRELPPHSGRRGHAVVGDVVVAHREHRRRRPQRQQPVRGGGRVQSSADRHGVAVLGVPAVVGGAAPDHDQAAGCGVARAVPRHRGGAPRAGPPAVLVVAAVRRRVRGQPEPARHSRARAASGPIRRACRRVAVHDRVAVAGAR